MTTTARLRARLSTQPRRGHAELEQLAQRVRDEHIFEILPGSDILLRPGMLTQTDRTALARDLPRLLTLLMSTPEAFFGGDVAAMCDAVGIHGPGRDAVLATSSDRSCAMGRADLMREDHSFKLLEFNVHSSAGGLENADLARAMLDVPMFADFARSEGLEYTDTIDAVATEIRRLWAARSIGRRPNVAIMDWPTTYPLFERSLERIASLLRDRGINAIPCHVGQTTLQDGRLHVGDLPIDILYRIFLIEDLLDEPERMEPILAAHRAGTLILAMSFIAELVGNKGSLALLSDAAAQGALSDGERELVERYVPWTRIVRSGRATWRGRSASILDVATRHRTELVLKPIIGHGGAGVMPGWTTSEHAWHAAVQAATRGPVSHVLQERVRPEAEWMPRLTSDDVEFEDVTLNWGAFVVGNTYAGCIIRGTPVNGNPVINVANGAASGCCVHAATVACGAMIARDDRAPSKESRAPATSGRRVPGRGSNRS